MVICGECRFNSLPELKGGADQMVVTPLEDNSASLRLNLGHFGICRQTVTLLHIVCAAVLSSL